MVSKECGVRGTSTRTESATSCPKTLQNVLQHESIIVAEMFNFISFILPSDCNSTSLKALNFLNLIIIEIIEK